MKGAWAALPADAAASGREAAEAAARRRSMR
jgi:hypothetical protein